MKKYGCIFAQTLIIVLVVISLLWITRRYWQPPVAAPLSQNIDISFRKAAKKAMPSVVNIYTQQKVAKSTPSIPHALLHPLLDENTATPPTPKYTLGSGVIVHKSGYIVTNSHVVGYADEIEVVLSDGTAAEAIVIGTDLETDLAVIKVDMPNLPAITFAHSNTVEVGDIVLALGNPFGVGQTVSMGVVSALGRHGLNIGTFENFIQTDAAIHHGNSGGALINPQGQLIGINTNMMSTYYNDNAMVIGFAIPSDTVRAITEEIIRTGTVTRGWVGVYGQDMTKELAQAIRAHTQSGVLITSIVPKEPAEQAGLVPGDILIAINQKPLKNFQMMLKNISAMAPGTAANITFERDGETLTQAITIGRRPAKKL